MKKTFWMLIASVVIAIGVLIANCAHADGISELKEYKWYPAVYTKESLLELLHEFTRLRGTVSSPIIPRFLALNLSEKSPVSLPVIKDCARIKTEWSNRHIGEHLVKSATQVQDWVKESNTNFATLAQLLIYAVERPDESQFVYVGTIVTTRHGSCCVAIDRREGKNWKVTIVVLQEQSWPNDLYVAIGGDFSLTRNSMA